MNDIERPSFEVFADQLKERVEDAKLKSIIPEQELGTRRTRKESEIVEPVLTFSGDELSPLIRALSNPLCDRFEVAKLTPDECDELANAYAKLFTKYFGTALEKYGAEIAALGVTLKVAGPRYYAYRAKKVEESQETKVEYADQAAQL